MDRQTDGHPLGQRDTQMGGQPGTGMTMRTDRRGGLDRQMCRQAPRLRDTQTDGQTAPMARGTDRWVDRQPDAQSDRHTDDWTPRKTLGWMDTGMDGDPDRRTPGQMDT